MLCIIGGYRGLYPRALGSLVRYAEGITEYAFVDDSGEPATVTMLEKWGRVVSLNREGYAPAMRAVCDIASDHDYVVWIEEDFTLTGPVNFTHLRDDLDAHPEWAQIVLQRQPWFPIEQQHGGVIEACIVRGETFIPDGDYATHQAFFSMNPMVARREVFTTGWPDVKWSEDAKRDELTAAGYRFAITRDVLCHHDATRTGKGY